MSASFIESINFMKWNNKNNCIYLEIKMIFEKFGTLDLNSWWKNTILASSIQININIH